MTTLALRLAGVFSILGAAFAAYCIHDQPHMALPYGMAAAIMLCYGIRALAFRKNA